VSYGEHFAAVARRYDALRLREATDELVDLRCDTR
jgi:hypothetical protein